MGKMIPVVETSQGGIDYNGTHYYIWAWGHLIANVKSRRRRRSSMEALQFCHYLMGECAVRRETPKINNAEEVAKLRQRAGDLEAEMAKRPEFK